MPVFKGKDPVLKSGGTVVDFVARCNRPERRVCVKEVYQEYPAPGCTGCFMVGKWAFHYSDGTKETLTKRWRT